MTFRSRCSSPAAAARRTAVGLPLLLAAVALLQTAPAITEQAADRQSWEAFDTAIRAAEEARRRGEPGLAEQRYLEAIERARRFGPGNLRLARAREGLADLYSGTGRYDEAEPLYRQVLEIWEKLLGPGQPRLATTMHNLAVVYLERGDPAGAEPLFRQSLEIWKSSRGPASEEVAISLDALATTLQRAGRREEAAPLIEQAQEIRDRRASGR